MYFRSLSDSQDPWGKAKLSYVHYIIMQVRQSQAAYIKTPFNPIPTEGGPFGPEQPKTVWHFHSFMTGVTKIHDFVCFSICLVPVKLFWEKKFCNFDKLKKIILTVLTPKGPPFGKKIRKIEKIDFFKENQTFYT